MLQVQEGSEERDHPLPLHQEKESSLEEKKDQVSQSNPIFNSCTIRNAQRTERFSEREVTFQEKSRTLTALNSQVFLLQHLEETKAGLNSGFTTPELTDLQSWSR